MKARSGIPRDDSDAFIARVNGGAKQVRVKGQQRFDAPGLVGFPDGRPERDKQAPETVEGGPAGPHSDLYSFSLIIGRELTVTEPGSPWNHTQAEGDAWRRIHPVFGRARSDPGPRGTDEERLGTLWEMIKPMVRHNPD
jgi:hypothetical protein